METNVLVIHKRGLMKILIVDDDADIREILEFMLKDFETISVTNGKEALEKYKDTKPDIVLMDIVMPEMDGIEATKEILKIDPNAKILAETAYANPKGKEMLEVGALDVIEKPFDPQKLTEKVKKYLG